MTDKEQDEVTARGQEMLLRLPQPIGARFDGPRNLIIVDLNWGYSLSFPPERVQALVNATAEQLATIELTVFGLYFPLLDVDLWVPSLAAGRFGNDRWEENWASKHRPEITLGRAA